MPLSRSARQALALLPHLCAVFGLLVFVFAISGRVFAAEPSGEQIFQAKCAACHGAHGEGTQKHRAPLAGSRSVEQLLDVISKTMPDDDPGSLSKRDADEVSRFVYDTIYSPIAQARNRHARIELARLTVNQYRQTVADLIGTFRSEPPVWTDERGLKGEYYDGPSFDGAKLKLKRVDPQVKFDFGTDSPVAKKIDRHEFAMSWTGSILTRETGQYDFIIHSNQSARLWVGEMKQPIVDAWVKSVGNDEYRATITLTGGRIYPIRLDFMKGQEGVRSKVKVDEAAKAAIGLWWRSPKGVDEPIPQRQLSPTWVPDAFVCTTPFPPDDRSYGWERGTTISREWEEATTDAAIEIAGYVGAHLDELAGTAAGAADRTAKLKAFSQKFATAAFRRPLDAAEMKSVVEHQFQVAKDADVAVKRVALRVLTAPEFLYREIGGDAGALPAAVRAHVSDYNVASRLSYGLWDSMPDAELLRAAASGTLSTKAEIAGQAERMLSNYRAKAKLHAFLLSWTNADLPRELAKDSKTFPGFDPSVAADLRTSLELFLDDVTWSKQSDFRQLFLADTVYMNGRLAKFYGAKLPADAPFQKVKLDGDRRAGVLTHPYLMASFAHSKDTSPVLRGVFLARGVLAVSLRPPPVAFVPLSVDLQPTLTTRERVSLQTKSVNCMICHGIINPLGFTLEHFDAVGRYRDKDNGRPVDASGTYKTDTGATVELHDARGLAKFLVDSDESQNAFVEQMFHHLVQQALLAYGPNARAELRQKFVADRFNIRKLAIDIMTATAQAPATTSVAQATASSP